MGTKNISIAATMCLAAVSFATGQDSPVMKGAKIETIQGTYEFTEGPCADREGNVYFTDQPSNRVFKIDLKGKVTVFMENAGRSNGMNFDGNGNLISCADEKTELWSITPDGSKTIIAAGYNGKAFNGPNDAFVRDDGGIYITDPFYKRSWWTHTSMPQDKQAVYYLAPGTDTGNASGTRKPVRVIDDFTAPNGITGSEDGKFLYVADIGANRTWKYKINPDGSLTDKTLFCDLGSDGMTIDSEGNLYLTGNGVTIFDKNGRKMENIRIPESWTANVCFGGADRKTLFITASRHVYRLKMRTSGTRIPGK